MNLFIDPLLKLNEYNELLSSMKEYRGTISIIGPSDSQKTHLIYSLCTHIKSKGVFVTYNEMQARRVYEDFSLFLGDEVVYFPTKETMLYNIEARSNDLMHQRVNAL